MLALAGHGAVPGVYREMKRPQDLGKVIGTSFVIMWCVYLAFTLTCYSIYGDQVEINIMNNFRKAPSLASAIVQALVLLKCFASIPGISCVLFESFKSDVKSRTVVILFIIGVSTLLRSELELVEVVTGGGCTVLTSYVFPVAFMIVIQATLRVRKRLCTEQQSAATTGTEPANEDEEIVDVTADDDDATV